MTKKDKSPALGQPGNGVTFVSKHKQQATGCLTAWRQWARAASVTQLSARQRGAVSLIQLGVVNTPEQALALLEAVE